MTLWGVRFWVQTGIDQIRVFALVAEEFVGVQIPIPVEVMTELAKLLAEAIELHGEVR